MNLEADLIGKTLFLWKNWLQLITVHPEWPVKQPVAVVIDCSLDRKLIVSGRMINPRKWAPKTAVSSQWIMKVIWLGSRKQQGKWAVRWPGSNKVTPGSPAFRGSLKTQRGSDIIDLCREIILEPPTPPKSVCTVQLEEPTSSDCRQTRERNCGLGKLEAAGGCVDGFH